MIRTPCVANARVAARTLTAAKRLGSRYDEYVARATAADRAHFRRIAEANSALESARQQEAGEQDPGWKIEEALRQAEGRSGCASR